MFINQLSIFIENRLGRLSCITNVLKDNNIDIKALSVADTRDFGILRIIVDDPTTAEKVLIENGCTVSLTSVIAIGIADRPGGLAEAMDVLCDNGIGVEYMYAFVSKSEDTAYVILRVEDNQQATDILTKNNIQILSPEDICKIVK